MSKYDAVYFVGDNQANNRVRVDSSRTSIRGAFLGSFAALVITLLFQLVPQYLLTDYILTSSISG